MENNFQIKKLEEYKEILHSCSKCGLCQKDCPVFAQTKNETNLARGIVIMLRNVLKGNLKLNNVSKHLDNCIACTKCKTICPSDIDMSEIAINIKKECLEKNKLKAFFIKFVQSKLIFGFYLFINKILKNVLIKKSKKFDNKVYFFSGCKISNGKLNRIIDDFNKKQIEVVFLDILCCGFPYLKSGNFNKFIKTAKVNNLKIKKYGKIYFTCENCFNVFNLCKKISGENFNSTEFVLFKDFEQNP